MSFAYEELPVVHLMENISIIVAYSELKNWNLHLIEE